MGIKIESLRQPDKPDRIKVLMFGSWRKRFSYILLATYFLITFFSLAPLADAAIPVTITSPTNGSVIQSSTVTITGTTAPNYTLYLSLDGRPAVATLADSFGNWSQTFTQLKSGNHSLTATVSGGPFAYFTDNGLFDGNLFTNTVSVLDTSTNLRVNTAQAGTSPGGVALSPDGTKLYVANFTDGTISIISTSNDQNIGTIPVSGCSTTGLAINPNGLYLYVGCWVGGFGGPSSEIKIIDLSSNSVIGSSGALNKAHVITVGPHPFGVSITPDGTKLLNANWLDASVGILSVGGGGSTLAELGPSPLATDGGAFSSGDTVLYVGITADSKKAYVGQYGDTVPTPENNIYVIDIPNTAICTTTIFPAPPSSTNCENATYPLTSGTFNVPLMARPVPILGSTKAYVSNIADLLNSAPGILSIVDTSTDTVSATTIPVNNNPTSIGYSQDGAKAYVGNYGSNNVSVIDVGSNSVTGTISNVPHPFTLGDFVGTKTTTQVIDFGSGTGGGFSFEIPKGFGFGESPIITNALPQNVLPNLKEFPSSIDNSLLGQFAQALRNTPAAIAYSFPYILFGLLGLLLLILFWQTRQEVAKVLALRRILERERLIAQEKDDFLVISSHYLRTPAAIISLGIDELRRTAKISATTIVALSASSLIITNRVKKLTEDVSNNVFLKDIEEPDVKTETINAFSSPYFFLPILSVGLLVILGNVAFASVGKISPSIINFMTQALIFVIVASLIYIFFRRRYLERQQRENYEKIVTYQRVLDNARNDFIDNTRNDLQAEVDKLKEIIMQSSDKKELKNVADGTKQLASMLAKFNILAQIESAQTKRVAKETNLSRIIDDILERRKPEINAKRLNVKITSEQIVASTDSAKLTFVLNSLIDNAIKFNKINGKIDIKVSQATDTNSITISDTGIGIKKADLAHIFKPFSRVGKALEFNYEGMGISLFINKIIMNYLGGDIMVESVQNRGTKTTIIFGNVRKGEIPVNVKWQQAPSFG